MTEPSLPPWLNSFLREPAPEDGEYYINLPYSDLEAWVLTDDPLFQATKIFPTSRLGGLHSLGLLAHAGPTPEMYYPLEPHHDRFDHTLVVAKTLEVIMRQNGFSKQQITIAIAAAVLHDIATPALGEATKSIDPVNLHEEDHWWEVLNDKAIAYLTELGATRDQIDAIIKNQGVVGQLLDIADRITYVMKDLFALVPKQPFEPSHDRFIQNLSAILEEDPKIGNIYQEVRVDHINQAVYFTDAQRLGRLLTLRALLHQGLYLHPLNQGRDLKWTQLMKPYYTTDDSAPDLLTPSRLRRMTDVELITYLAQAYGLKEEPLGLWHDLRDWYPRHYERFTTTENADADAARLRQDPRFTVIGVKEIRGFDPAVTYVTQTPTGGKTEYQHVDPKRARELTAIAQSTQGIYLYYSVNAGEPTPFDRIFSNY